jgi:hypothetical protein
MAILICPGDAPACSKINKIKKNRLDMGVFFPYFLSGLAGSAHFLRLSSLESRTRGVSSSA